MIQLHVCAALGIGMKYLIDHGEKIEEPSFIQCCLDGSPPLALAKAIAVNMRMGRFRTAGCRIRFQGDDRVWHVAVQLPQVQADSERSKADALQFNRLCHYHNFRIVDNDAAEVVFNRNQLFVQRPRRRDDLRLDGAALGAHVTEQVRQAIEIMGCVSA